MPQLITNRDSARKPYLGISHGIDGGYVDEMQRTTQKMDLTPKPVVQTRSHRGEVVAEREKIRTVSLVSLGKNGVLIYGMCAAPNGDLYYSEANTDIYYRDATGSGDFVALSQGTLFWYPMCAAPNGDIYCANYGGDIYKRAAGAGDFTALSQTSRAWRGLAAAPNGDIYATVYSGDIYKKAAADANFLPLSQTSRRWEAITVAPNGDVYAVATYGASTGDIYIRSGGVGDFVDMDQTHRDYEGLAAVSNGDIYAVVSGGDIYRRIAGAGDFVAEGLTTKVWRAIAAVTGGPLYVATWPEYGLNDIYMFNDQLITQPAVNTITQTKQTVTTTEETTGKNLKPYANKTYEDMQYYNKPVKYTSKQQTPETKGALPALPGRIEETVRYARLGDPVVISVPTDKRDPVVGVKIEGRADGGDGTASVAPDGASVVYKPGRASSALLIIHTKSGQTCTATLMAK